MLAVLEHLHAEGDGASFTTREIAEGMGAAEGAVRMVLSGLCRLGKVAAVGSELVRRRTRTAGDMNEVAVYRLQPKSETAVEFQAFYMRVCHGRG